MTDRNDRLFARAVAILEGRANGYGVPVLRHLALRGYGPALLWLADREDANCERRKAGRLSDAFSPLGMMYRAFRKGEPKAGQNLAMTFWNMGDLPRYRGWLHRAAQRGDLEAAHELRQFELRKPHGLARRLRRLRPYRRDGS